jgi:hypothetical protein
MPTLNLEKFDTIIIGTGHAGKPLAIDLGNAGWLKCVSAKESSWRVFAMAASSALKIRKM